MRLFVIIVGAAILIDGLSMAVLSTFGLGVALTLLLGALLTAYGIFFRQVNQAHGPLIWLRNLGFFGLGCAVAMSAFLTVYGVMDSKAADVDAVIVLGASVRGKTPSLALVRRMERAVKLHSENPDALIVVSGGKGVYEDISEAEAMREYLVKNGVAEDKIIMEDNSFSTRENFRNSKKLLDERLGGGYRAAYITNEFHVYRAGLIAKREGFEKPAHFHASTDWFIWPQSYLRECLAVVKTWIFG